VAHGRRRKKQKREGAVDVGLRVWEIVHRKVPDEVVRLTRIREAWDEIAPEWVATNTWPALVRDDRLVLNVRDNQWLHELHYWRTELIERMAQRLPDTGIQTIEAFLGHVPPPGQRGEVEPAPPPAPRRPSPLEGDPPVETIAALNAVKDIRLRDILAAARLRMGQSRNSSEP
jgi:hypothetical protein